jgi:hypothetical protein
LGVKHGDGGVLAWTNNSGNDRSASVDVNQNALGSPSAADSHASSVIGAGVGDAAGVESRNPNIETTRTFPSLIGRKSQRSGMPSVGVSGTTSVPQSAA